MLDYKFKYFINIWRSKSIDVTLVLLKYIKINLGSTVLLLDSVTKIIDITVKEARRTPFVKDVHTVILLLTLSQQSRLCWPALYQSRQFITGKNRNPKLSNISHSSYNIRNVWRSWITMKHCKNERISLNGNINWPYLARHTTIMVGIILILWLQYGQ